MRSFAYLRVSTSNQETETQLSEIKLAGYDIDPQRVIAETISGTVKALEREGFSRLLNKLEKGDQLVVTKIDRLGRNASDILNTVGHLTQLGVHIICLQLGSTDLASPAGKMLVAVLSALSEMERDLISERTKASLARLKGEGKKLGRPNKLTVQHKVDMRTQADAGVSISVIARNFDVSRISVHRAIREATEA